MSNHHLKKSNPPEPAATSLPRRRLIFRLLAVVGVPLILVGLLECSLRLAGFGSPTSFLLSTSHQGQAVWIQNNRFGWQFFGREMARWPYPLLVPQSKSTNTIRIFVLGESAARGEPQPDFGLPRMLQALLSVQYPEARFEVVNTAMTAINSHAILPIARDCARADGDVWVIYMGNNEVVGPFGAGTVFGSVSSPLPVIRTGLAFKRTRVGQLLEDVGRPFEKSPSDDSVWGGMTLFLDHQVRADDPRLARVYRNFDRNLRDILRTGQAAGVPIVLSTVAVNLKDCPPFASEHRPGLSEAELATWQKEFELGCAAMDSGNLEEATARFAAAAHIDDSYADLQFRQGQVALRQLKNDEAAAHFRAARDADTLRFRCDTTLEDLIRRAATNHAGGPVLLADSERVFAQRSGAGIPGEDLFYEHVHLTFRGNYLLARAIAAQLVTVLPDWVKPREEGPPWPSLNECAQWLGHTEWHRVSALNSILTTLSDPPFTGQLGHADRILKLEKELNRLSVVLQPEVMARAVETCEQAVELTPNDAVLHRQLAALRKASGDPDGAAVAVRRALQLLPNDPDSWALLGSILAQKQEYDEATEAFRRAFETGPQGIQAMLDLAGAVAALGRKEEAIAECRAILKRKPHCVPAWLQLGQLSESMGNQEKAEECFQAALSHRSQRLPELIELAAFFRARGDFEVAVELGEEALLSNPSDPELHVWTGRDLASLGRYEDAERHSAEAVRLEPRLVEARLLHGVVLWKLGSTPAAMAEFEEALQLQPESVDARLNLGMALAQQGRGAEALEQFDEVLKLDPTHATALRYTETLRRNESGNTTSE